MKRIPALTAFEIVDNSRDLFFMIWERDGKTAFAIKRGPQHSLKTLLDTTPKFKDKEEAIKRVREILTQIEGFTVSVFGEGNDFGDGLIDRVCADLAATNTARTHQYQ